MCQLTNAGYLCECCDVVYVGNLSSLWNVDVLCPCFWHMTNGGLYVALSLSSSVVIPHSFIISESNNNSSNNKHTWQTAQSTEVQFLFQRISVLIQRFNSVLFYKTFPVEDDTDT